MDSIVESINSCGSLDSSTKLSLVNIVTETAGFTNGHQDKMQALTETAFKEAALLSITNIKIAENQKSLEEKIDSLRSDIQSLASKIDTKIKCQMNFDEASECTRGSTDWVEKAYKFRWQLTILLVTLMMLASISPRIAEICNSIVTQKKEQTRFYYHIGTNEVSYTPLGVHKE